MMGGKGAAAGKGAFGGKGFGLVAPKGAAWGGGGGSFGAPAKGGMMGKGGGKMGGKNDMMGMMMGMMGGGMKGKGKGKDKGKSKNKGKGHTLPRERITETPMIGEVLEWKGKYGWVKPSEDIQHPKFMGKLFVSMTDLTGVEATHSELSIFLKLFSSVVPGSTWNFGCPW